MRRIIWVIVVLGVLSSTIMSCGGRHPYDGRLVAADSLMQDFPDSALALVEGVCRDSLTAESDRAYRDLLFTQARYRCYITATSDSDINHALAYYRAHSIEREKLTRAYIYKGAVMEEMGHPDSAMFYYKNAEATAATDDYFNLGYSKMRMGALYRDYFSMEGRHIKKMEEALDCFLKTNDYHMQLVCMINLGCLYRLKEPHKSIQMLSSAASLALDNQDTIGYINSEQNLLNTLYTQERYEEARQMVWKIQPLLNNYYNVSFFANAADVYAKLGMADSAQYFLNHINKNEIDNVIDELLYLESVGEVALSRGDTVTYRNMEYLCGRKSDSLQSIDTSTKIIRIESDYDDLLLSASDSKNKAKTYWMMALAALMILVVTALLLIHYKRKHQYDKLILDLRTETAGQLKDLSSLRDTLAQLDIKDTKLSGFLDSYMNLFQQMLDELYHNPMSKANHNIKQIINIQKNNEDIWLKLLDYVDIKHNNIISFTKANYDYLNNKDLLVLAMTTLGFSYIQMAMVLGYNNATTISSIKQRLAKKMGLDCSLNEYIKRFQE